MSSSVYSSIARAKWMPALLTSTSMPPKRVDALRDGGVDGGASDTSAASAIARRPQRTCAFADRLRLASRSTKRHGRPARANRSAVARPIPRPRR